MWKHYLRLSTFVRLLDLRFPYYFLCFNIIDGVIRALYLCQYHRHNVVCAIRGYHLDRGLLGEGTEIGGNLFHSSSVAFVCCYGGRGTGQCTSIRTKVDITAVQTLFV